MKFYAKKISKFKYILALEIAGYYMGFPTFWPRPTNSEILSILHRQL
jgi:hypothetical protein